MGVCSNLFEPCTPACVCFRVSGCFAGQRSRRTKQHKTSCSFTTTSQHWHVREASVCNKVRVRQPPLSFLSEHHCSAGHEWGGGPVETPTDEAQEPRGSGLRSLQDSPSSTLTQMVHNVPCVTIWSLMLCNCDSHSPRACFPFSELRRRGFTSTLLCLQVGSSSPRCRPLCRGFRISQTATTSTT